MRAVSSSSAHDAPAAPATPVLATLARAPDFAHGYVKDLRVRWALEEAGRPYRTSMQDEAARSGPYRVWQPFGQVPAWRDGTVEMFESAAIVLHLASQSERLSPQDPAGAARVASWVLAAVATVQPQVDVSNFVAADLPETPRAACAARLASRLAALECWLGERDWLEDRFTAGDLVMATAVREVDPATLQDYGRLSAWLTRCLDRPAFHAALAAQRAELAG
ncbi:glutathione S-transferase family protein [Aurantimonas sp. A2-1-M11]|uniref:glutathione S-transferase family protein n=1 Tax=Aurantimonas sp. A2-1-M11 TaxID=3113712 RepID=UPI002F93D805